MKELPLQLTIFANIFKDHILPDLAKMAQPEKWDFVTTDTPRYTILWNYICKTYTKLAELYNAESDDSLKNKWVYIDKKCACFNTGLFTPQYNQIFLYFVPNNPANPKYNQPWYCLGPREEHESHLINIRPLPLKARYINSVEDLVFDTNLELRVNKTHILEDERNLQRIPENLRDSTVLQSLLDGAIGTAIKKITANYKIAVPQYYQGKMQLLIPLSFLDKDQVDVVLAVSKENNLYIGHTALTIDQAYNNARLIIKPDVDWLKLN